MFTEQASERISTTYSNKYINIVHHTICWAHRQSEQEANEGVGEGMLGFLYNQFLRNRTKMPFH